MGWGGSAVRRKVEGEGPTTDASLPTLHDVCTWAIARNRFLNKPPLISPVFFLKMPQKSTVFD